MTPNFVVFVRGLLPMCCHIGRVCHICAFLLNKLSRYYVQSLKMGVKTCLWSEFEHK